MCRRSSTAWPAHRSGCSSCAATTWPRTDLRLPPNATRTGYVRHGAVLPHADLVIDHAGLGTVLAALAHGLPQLCVPLGRDQPANAAAVSRTGAGVVRVPSTRTRRARRRRARRARRSLDAGARRGARGRHRWTRCRRPRGRRARRAGHRVNLDPATAERYLRHAFARMLGVADRLGDERVNVRPHGDGTNAVAALVVHCCGVAEFWLGHVALGRPSHPRPGGRVLEHRVRRRAARRSWRRRSPPRRPTSARSRRARAAMPAGGSSCPKATRRTPRSSIHVLEEAFQHLGHMELAADALLADQPPASS